MAKAIANLAVNLEAETLQFQRDMKKAAGNFESSVDQMKTAAKAMGAAIAAYFTIDAIKGVAEYTREVIRSSAELSRSARMAGFAADEFQGLTLIAKEYGLGQDSVNELLVDFTRRLGDAQSGTQSYVEAYQRLGIEIKDSTGEFKKAEDVFFELVDVYRKLERETDKVFLTSELMGDAGSRLAVMFEDGADSIRSQIDAYKDYGAVIDEELLASSEEADKALTRLESSFGNLTRSLTLGLAPAITEVVNGFQLMLDYVYELQKIGSIFSPLSNMSAGASVAQKYLRRSAQQGRVYTGPTIRADLPPAAKDEKIKTTRTAPSEFDLYLKQLEREAESLRDILKTDRELYDEQRARLTEMRDLGVISQAELEKFNKYVQNMYLGFIDASRRAAMQMESNMSDIFLDAMYGEFDNFFEKIIAGFDRLVADMLAKLLMVKAQEAMIGMAGSGGLVGNLGNFGKFIFGGFRHSGGPVTEGRAYAVQPSTEMFIPQSSGSVSAQSGGITINGPAVQITSNGDGRINGAQIAQELMAELEYRRARGDA